MIENESIVGFGEIVAHELPPNAYWYLGSPYSKFPSGLDAAFQEICRIAGEFARRGIAVYSPIAHTHPIAVASGLDPLDHNIWLPFDEPMMHGAYGLIVALMPTWEISKGLKHEIDTFERLGRPVVYMRV
jgi:hypothetical protein